MVPPGPTGCGAWEGHIRAGCPAPGLGSIRVPLGLEAPGRDCGPRRGLYLGLRRAACGYLPGEGGGSACHVYTKTRGFLRSPPPLRGLANPCSGACSLTACAGGVS